MKLPIALAVGLLLAGPVSAQDWDKVFAAIRAGDFATALQVVRPLAEQGQSRAQGMLGLMYAGGKGVPQDLAEAAKWSRLSAEQGEANAQYDLGLMYAFGNGVLQDYSEAVKWWRLAAEQGNADAQQNLGFMHIQGRGVPQDDVTSHMWFNIAAANGNEKGQKNRDLIAKIMTPADISEAQRRARVCLASNYQDCD